MAIEDVWPTLFFGSDRLDEIRRKVEEVPWAREAFHRWQAEAAQVLAEPPQLPIEPIGWRHDFYSPTTAEHLLFDPAQPDAYVDPWDQTVYSGASASQFTAIDARRRAWALLVHERTYRLMRSVGVLYGLTGDEHYAEWVALGMRRAVEMFRRHDFRQENTRSRALYFQMLYEAQVLLLLANAYELTRLSPAYSEADHAQIRAEVFEAGMPYQIEFLDSPAPPNMMCYSSAALATVADVFERPDWRQLAFEHPRSGLFAILANELKVDEHGQVDGFWAEGTQFYHFYSICPLVTLFERAQREHSAGRLDTAAAGAVLTWEEASARFESLFRAPAMMADDRLRLPAFGDLGAPKVLSLRLYRHLYEFAAGQLSADVYRPLLSRIYSTGVPRSSLAAVAYGTDSLSEVSAPGEETRGALDPTLDLLRERSTIFPASGIAVLRFANAGDARNAGGQWQVFFRAGAHGQGHDHMDKLSFGLHAGGEVVTADLGTAGYGLKEFTSFCRSTFAHNTLMVDEQSQGKVTRAHLRSGTDWAAGLIEDAYPDVRLERTLALRPPYLLIEDRCDSETEHRYSWMLHLYGSLAVHTRKGAAERRLNLPPLPDAGPLSWFANQRVGQADDALWADWRVRDGLWVRLWVTSDGPFEWTVGQTPGNPIPDRRSTLLLRAPGTNRRFRAALEVHHGAPTLPVRQEVRAALRLESLFGSTPFTHA